MVFILLDDHALVALLPDGMPLHPWALTAPISPARFAAGDPVRTAESAVEVGTFRIRVDAAEIADLALSDRPRVLPAETELLLRLGGHASAAAQCGGTWVSALDQFRSGGDAHTLTRLLGAGNGLTPSGDDALVGVLAALDWVRDACPEAAPLREALVPLLAWEAPLRTARLSAQLLVAAAAGQYAEPVLGLFGSIVGEHTTELRLNDAVASLLAMGHESGSATLAGIVSALGRLLPGWIEM